ncbi:MAG: type VI secretion protein IcmF/TssM N-terminal domain-containing protein [Planctomycetia bacterium]|nr:type VI secretion protein IcmF/TssM N-terminal domain-containing protein [Planctomycetia bacterium]
MGRIWQFFKDLALNIVRAPGRFAQLSVPAIAATLSVFLLLSFLVIVVLIGRFDDSYVGPWAHFTQRGWSSIGIILCLIVTPIVVYYAVRLWLEGDVSRFPDIDYAWKRGLAEMERAGLDPTMAPIVLVLGGRDAQDAKALAADPRQGFRVRGAPEDPGSGVAMQWFAGKRSIVLVATFVGQLCELAQLSDGATDAHAAEDEVSPSLTESGRTMMLGDPRAATPRSVRPQPTREGTAMIEGTMFVPSGEGSKTAFIAISQPGVIQKAAARMNSDAAAEQQLRLRYLCRLLRRLRRPYCPVNGMIALTPYQHLLREADAVSLETALRADLDVAFQTLMVRCPTSVLVTGMDLDRGFDELSRRVGEERTTKQRFGKGFELWRPQSDENMHTAVRHACAAFEDWTYKLFREPGALEERGNRDLFALVCRMRGRVQQHLMHLLESCFARTAGEESRLLFSGLYFSTLGSRPAFATAMIEKMIEQQEELEWTREALQTDARCRIWAKCALGAAALFLAAVAATTWQYAR